MSIWNLALPIRRTIPTKGSWIYIPQPCSLPTTSEQCSTRGSTSARTRIKSLSPGSLRANQGKFPAHCPWAAS
uniref:Uncharacterized protein n=1 Tax=Arundo donax TaxID=35708 RepID=A0A0A9BRH4_ARUDO